MPVYTYTDANGESGSIYAANIFEAEDEIYATTGDHPDYLREEI